MSNTVERTVTVEDFRARHEHFLGRYFNGYLYFGFANAVALGGIAFALYHLQDFHWTQLWIVPISFVAANFGEWLAHKGPMHQKRDLLEILFAHHVLVHHVYFPHDHMAARSHKDWGFVLFPAWAIFLVFAAAAPVSALLGYLIHPNIGWLFFIVGIAYYLLYEWIHLMHHLPEDHPIGRLPIAKWLRRHHKHHHNLRLMQKYNYNVTFPIADYIMGTAYREPKDTP